MIRSGLTVSREKDAAGQSARGGSGVLNLSFRGGNPQDCRLMLEAVIAAHAIRSTESATDCAAPVPLLTVTLYATVASASAGSPRTGEVSVTTAGPSAHAVAARAITPATQQARRFMA